MNRAFFIGMAIICALSLSACGTADTHAGYRGDWRNFGLFYVQENEIG